MEGTDQNKWVNNLEKEEDEIFNEAANRYEMHIKRQHDKKMEIENNKNLILTLEPNFMISCYKKFIINAYFYNLSMILINYLYLKKKGYSMFHKIMIFTPLLLVGNTLILQYWMYRFPLAQYHKGLAKIVEVENNNRLI